MWEQRRAGVSGNLFAVLSSWISRRVDQDFNPPELTLVSFSLGQCECRKDLRKCGPCLVKVAEFKTITFKSTGHLHRRMSKHGLFNTSGEQRLGGRN